MTDEKINWWEWLVVCMIVTILVLISLSVLDRYDEHLVEKEAAAALEPHLDLPTQKLIECGVRDGEQNCWPPLSHNPPSPAKWISTSPAPKPRPKPSKDPFLFIHTGPPLEVTGYFIQDPSEHQDVMSYDYRWVYINLRDTQGSIKLDRKEGRAWFCPVKLQYYGDPDKWCVSHVDETSTPLVPWLMVPTPEAR